MHTPSPRLYAALKAYRTALFEQAFDDLLCRAHDIPRDNSKMIAVIKARDEAAEAAKHDSMGNMTRAFVECMPLAGD